MKKFINKIMTKSMGYYFTKYNSKKDEIFGIQKKLCSTNKRVVIFDVGAYTGESAITYNKYFDKKCDIYSFEPFKESFDRLLENTKSYDNVKPFNFALGNKNEKTTFHVNNFSATNSFFPSSEEGIKNWGAKLMDTKSKIQVDVQTIDQFVAEQNINRIDILKMDTQGTEHLVLEGAEESIRQGKVRLIFSELIVTPSYEGQKDLDEQLRMFKDYGFELYNLYTSTNDQKKLRFMDGIFVYKEK